MNVRPEIVVDLVQNVETVPVAMNVYVQMVPCQIQILVFDVWLLLHVKKMKIVQEMRFVIKVIGAYVRNQISEMIVGIHVKVFHVVQMLIV